jgi:acyl-coenzyme A thioesterase PaaI-like protein
MKDVRAEAKAIRAGRTIVYVQVDVIDSDEKFVASGRVTYLILRPR